MEKKTADNTEAKSMDVQFIPVGDPIKLELSVPDKEIEIKEG